MKKYPLLASTLIAATAMAVPAFAFNADVTWTGNGSTTDSDGNTMYIWSDLDNWNVGDNTSWADNYGWTGDGGNTSNRKNAVFNGNSSTDITVLVNTDIYVGHLIITGGSYTIEYSENGSISAQKNIVESDDLDVLYVNGGSLTINGGTNSFTGSRFYIDIGYDAAGSLTINGGTNTFNSGSGMYVGYAATGTLTITDGTNTFSDLFVASMAEGTVTISGGKNTFTGDKLSVGRGDGITGYIYISDGENIFSCTTVYVGGYENSNTGKGIITISGGKNTFTSAIELGTVGTGEMTITGGTTTISGATTIADGSSISIGGGDTKATVNLETKIGTSATGTVTISDNANIVLSGSLLTSLEATIGEDNAWVAIITANTIIFDTLELTSASTGEDDLDSVINQYISAGDYLLTWTWDTSDSTLYASIAGTTSVPEPGMFSVFFGIGALGLVATRRRRRKA